MNIPVFLESWHALNIVSTWDKVSFWKMSVIKFQYHFVDPLWRDDTMHPACTVLQFSVHHYLLSYEIRKVQPSDEHWWSSSCSSLRNFFKMRKSFWSMQTILHFLDGGSSMLMQYISYKPGLLIRFLFLPSLKNKNIETHCSHHSPW